MSNAAPIPLVTDAAAHSGLPIEGAVRAQSVQIAISPWWTLLFVTIVSAPIHLVFFGNPSFDSWRYRPYLALVDLLVIALVATRCLSTVRALIADRRDLIGRALTVLFLVLAVSFALHPGSLGAATIMRLAGIVVIAHMIGRADRRHLALVVTIFVVTTAFEALVTLGQKLTGRALGLAFLGEVGSPFNPLGTHRAPVGTIFYPYPLAGMGLVAASIAIAATVRAVVPIWVGVVGAVAGGVLVGLSFSVAGAISAMALLSVGVLALKFDRSVARRALAIGLIGFAVGLIGAGAIDYGGWAWKGARSTHGVEEASNGRMGMLREATAIVKRWPLIGVGPGNFMKTRDAHPDIKAIASEPQPVHMVPLLIVVEGGIPAALALVALGVAMVAGFRRSGWMGPMIAVSFSGFLLFDHYPWLFGIGTVTLGVWFGAMTALAQIGRGPAEQAADALPR